MKHVLMLLGIGIMLLVVACNPVDITNFEECEKAGYTIREINPRECVTLKGDIFEEQTQVNPEKEDFCGSSTGGECVNDEDCIPGGCSGQLCHAKEEKQSLTICDFRECYDAEEYELECGCVDGGCQWN